jgi:pantoate--beta-alanine ligase
MLILSSALETHIHCRRQEGQIGLVPTMGFLHEGHLSLVRQARADSNFVVVSIFVNPTQFGPTEDFDTYPRDFDQDCRLLEAEGVDLLFVPSVEEMYPKGNATSVEVTGNLTKGLCGASRPGHFRGVTTVVSKLFNIVQPHRAYFGQKDAQQLAVIKRLASDLNWGIEIVGMPIIRESDGLAMSSRNRNLNPEERRSATCLYYALQRAKARIEAGQRNAERVLEGIREVIGREKLARIDYIEIVSLNDFEPVDGIEGEVLIALAVFIGETRLIDNLQLTI